MSRTGSLSAPFLALPAILFLLVPRLPAAEAVQGEDLGRWAEALPQELRDRPEPLAEAENAYPLLVEAGNAHVALVGDSPSDKDVEADEAVHASLVEDAAPPGGETARAIDRWTKANEKALRLLDDALARRAFQAPELETSVEAMIGLRGLCLLKLARTRLLAGRGEFEGAVDEVTDCLDLGDLIGAGNHFQFLIGSAFLSLAAQTSRWLASRPGIPPRSLDRLFRRICLSKDGRAEWRLALRNEVWRFAFPSLRSFPEENAPQSLARALAGDFALGEHKRGFLKDVTAVLEGHPKAFDKEATARGIADHYRRLVEDSKKPWAERRDGDAEKKEILAAWPEEIDPRSFGPLGETPKRLSPSRLKKVKKDLARIENPLGRLQVAMLGDRYPMGERGPADDEETNLLQAFLRDADREAAKTVLALRVYLERKGSATPLLAALVEEKVLPTVPLDPFSEKPLEYSLARGLIWSVGPKGDENGQSTVGEDGERKIWIWKAPEVR